MNKILRSITCLLSGSILFVWLAMVVMFVWPYKIFVHYPSTMCWNGAMLTVEDMNKMYEDGKRRLEKTGNPSLDYKWQWF